MRTATAVRLVDGRYELRRRLGEGGQAAVFAVFDHRMGVARAMKVMLPHLAQKRKLRARFEREARTMAQLDHPNVVRVYDVASSGKVVYFVMEQVRGGTLMRRLRRAPLPPQLAIRTMLEISAGVEAAHAQGIIHRDLKPQNVLVTLDGIPKIADFGIARHDDGMMTRQHAAMGTVGFTAPEQMEDARSVDVRADVYSLGMTLFVMLAATDPAHWHRRHTHARVPEPLRVVIERATQEEPEDRYEDVPAFAEALRRAAAALPSDPVQATLCCDTEEDDDGEAEEEEGTTTLEEVATWFEDEEPTRASRPTPVSVSRGYTMSRPSQTPVPARPDWIVEEAPRPQVLPETFEVPTASEEVDPTLDGPTRQRTSTAAARQREHVPTKKTAVDSAAAELFVLLARLPWGIIAPVTVLGLIVASFASWRIWQVTHAERLHRQETEVALETAMADQQQVVQGLSAIGANGETLERLRHSWVAARDDQSRERIRRLYLTELHREADRVLQAEDVELREAIEQLDETVATWERAHPELAPAPAPE
ncbi:MAG: serine/threonine protein kinase [Alphaproteobacteria bacterium]|nr:serine/threonine protein kinase [Alphaproteobacteria bacterium]MCB9697280.1 serine/threonine protein kinase [Alphaproteobacteria bacterium]